MHLHPYVWRCRGSRVTGMQEQNAQTCTVRSNQSRPSTTINVHLALMLAMGLWPKTVQAHT